MTRSGQLADPPVSSASPDPSASPVPSVAPVAPVPPVSSATGHQPYPTNPVHLRIPTTVSFPHVSAAVLSAGPLRVNGAPVDEYVVRVRTCVRSAPAGATNISARLTEADWSLTTSSGRVTVDDPIRSPVPLTTTYPPTSNYPVGTCVSGTIPFGVGRSGDRDRDPLHQQPRRRGLLDASVLRIRGRAAPARPLPVAPYWLAAS